MINFISLSYNIVLLRRFVFRCLPNTFMTSFSFTCQILLSTIMINMAIQILTPVLYFYIINNTISLLFVKTLPSNFIIQSISTTQTAPREYLYKRRPLYKHFRGAVVNLNACSQTIHIEVSNNTMRCKCVEYNFVVGSVNFWYIKY